eukprot:365535-Chlamydomonas_euryale.AAC.30
MPACLSASLIASRTSHQVVRGGSASAVGLGFGPRTGVGVPDLRILLEPLVLELRFQGHLGLDSPQLFQKRGEGHRPSTQAEAAAVPLADRWWRRCPPLPSPPPHRLAATSFYGRASGREMRRRRVEG